MTWSMSWFRNSSARHLPGACLLLALLLLCPGLVRAQESFDQRFQDAEKLMQSGSPGSIEEACNAFKLLDKEKPGDKQVQAFLRASCTSFDKLQKKEDDLFNEGVQHLKQNQLSDAKQSFEQSGRLTGLKTFRHKDEALKYIKQIDAQLNDEQTFQDGLKLFTAKNYTEAQSRFNQVVQGGGPKSGDARDYLAKIKVALGNKANEEAAAKTFDDGVRLFKAKEYDAARDAFNKVVSAGLVKVPDARNYLAKIDQQVSTENRQKEILKTFNDGVGFFKAQKYDAARDAFHKVVNAGVVDVPEARDYLAKIDKLTTPAATPTPTDDTLRAGLKAYFGGNLQEAQRNLKDYIEHNGQKKGLAYFFSGAVHSTRYFLSGEKDSGEKSQAVADFQAAKSSEQGFSPPSEKYVSPKILDIYNQAPGQ